MEIKIEEGKNQSLYAYKNNELVFYSISKHNWFKQVISIFDSEDKLVLEIKSKISFFLISLKLYFMQQLITEKLIKFLSMKYLLMKKELIAVREIFFLSI